MTILHPGAWQICCVSHMMDYRSWRVGRVLSQRGKGHTHFPTTGTCSHELPAGVGLDYPNLESRY